MLNLHILRDLKIELKSKGIFDFIQVFAERMGLETGWNCHISLREGSHLLEDRGSSATVSERNAESLYDIQDDVNVTGQDGDEKHVSWWGVQGDSVEKGIVSFFGGGGMVKATVYL